VDARLMLVVYAGVWGRGLILVACVVLTGGVHSPFLIAVPAAVISFAMLGTSVVFFLRTCLALWVALMGALLLVHGGAALSLRDVWAVAGLYWVTVAPSAAITSSLRTVNSLALRDAVTGLTNHRYFQEALRVHAAQAERHNRSLSLLMIDLDDFKLFNDRYGHPAGDRLLRELGELLNRVCRAGDIVSRYGGEEFAVLLPDTPLSEAVGAAERLRQSVAVRIFSRGPVRISIGLASFPDHAGSPRELLNMADNALYEAKWGGKNRVVVAEVARAVAMSR
jgi:diguanylate cyclase (GGDEF)-like protein